MTRGRDGRGNSRPFGKGEKKRWKFMSAGCSCGPREQRTTSRESGNVEGGFEKNWKGGTPASWKR